MHFRMASGDNTLNYRLSRIKTMQSNRSTSYTIVLVVLIVTLLNFIGYFKRILITSRKIPKIIKIFLYIFVLVYRRVSVIRRVRDAGMLSGYQIFRII